MDDPCEVNLKMHSNMSALTQSISQCYCVDFQGVVLFQPGVVIFFVFTIVGLKLDVTCKCPQIATIEVFAKEFCVIANLR